MDIAKILTVNQRVAGSSPAEGAKALQKCEAFLFYLSPMFYIYILQSIKSDITYIGYSENPKERLIQHNTKEEGTFSSKHKPWELKAVFEAGTKSEAVILERFIKKQKSKKLIEKLINPDFIPEGKLAQLVRVPHVRD